MRATQGFAGVLGVCLLSAPAAAQVTSRVSVAAGGAQVHGTSVSPVVSADGRFVAFASEANDLVPWDGNGDQDIFVRETLSGAIECVSVSSGGQAANGRCDGPSISSDGRFVVFQSEASNLVAGDNNGRHDVFVRDRLNGTTELVSLATSGAQGNGVSGRGSISDDGRWVVFTSWSSDLVAGDTNGVPDVFLRDRVSGTLECLSVGPGGLIGDDGSFGPSISPDGRFVTFDSGASNFVSGDTNSAGDVFVWDRLNGTLERVSLSSSGTEANNTSLSASISADGRWVAFESSATNLVGADTNHYPDVFVHDRQSGATERVSVSANGSQVSGPSYQPRLSASGRFVAFQCFAPDIVPGDTNGAADAILRDLQTGATVRASVNTPGRQGNDQSEQVSVSADGRFVAFLSYSRNLVPDDTNGTQDVFLRDLAYSAFTSGCEPGSGGVVACPCSNPPAGTGRGCDNSAATGGAVLSATGVACLSQDTLRLTSSGQLPSGSSIVLQAGAEVAQGLVFGQGVRCAGGTLVRLFVKVAAGGGVHAPEPATGDAPVSLRSAQLGDAIQAGESRWYLVYYRDPIVLGACPATSTFNATQTGRVLWWP